MDEVADFANSGGCVVGVRSGLLDLLMYTECKLVAVYAGGEPLREFFDLNMLPEKKADLLQISVNSDKEIYPRIISFLKGE